jgi:putative addiction module component (TIGR02574 family)
MSKDLTEVLRDASELSEQDRATLAGLLIESLETEADSGVEETWVAEIARRVAQLEAGDTKISPWEEVRQRLRDRLNAR